MPAESCAPFSASPPMAEEIVQDAFVALHDSWRRLRNDDHALLYLQQQPRNVQFSQPV